MISAVLMIQAGRPGPKEVHFDEHTEDQGEIFSNVGVRIINHPFGNGLYQLSMVIWGMVYYCYTHMTAPNLIDSNWVVSFCY